MGTLSFTKDAARNLAKAYATPDMVGQRDAVLQLLDLHTAETVIDIGCGPGFLCEKMAQKVGASGAVLGVDISPDLIELCKDRKPPSHLSYAQEDATALASSKAAFDVAVCTQVAEYIPDTSAVLAEMFRVLRPGGRALVMATDWNCVGWHSNEPGRMNRVLRAWEGHCAHAGLPRTLASSMQVAGFETLQITAHPVINTRFEKTQYSFGLAKLMRSYAENTGFSKTEVAQWFDDLTRLDAAGQYYFCSARIIFVARKPA
ncbi:MAG: methyltransferase domain-containing protein [Roseobacter sp.]